MPAGFSSSYGRRSAPCMAAHGDGLRCLVTSLLFPGASTAGGPEQRRVELPHLPA